jgi:glucose/arabinose dehydrogenase
VPDIAPGNMVFYKGAMFPQWDGNGSVWMLEDADHGGMFRVTPK